MEATADNSAAHVPWNKDKLTGQKSPLKLNEIWAIRIRLQLGARTRDLAMFNLALDSNRHATENAAARAIRDHGANTGQRGMLDHGSRAGSFRLPVPGSHSRLSPYLDPPVREDRPSMDKISIGRDDTAYGTHTMRRTKASLIYRRTKNLRAVNCCLVTPNLKVQSDTSASRSMMPLRWRNRPRSE